MPTPAAVRITAALAALALAGCGGSSSSGSSAATSTSTASTAESAATSTVASATTSAGPGGQPASGTIVGIRAGQFIPARVVVLAGHPIHFENFGPQAHGVTALSGARFASGQLGAGQVFTWTPTRTGTVRYRDPAAPHAAGTIVVIQ
jgi:plastocyanin